MKFTRTRLASLSTIVALGVAACGGSDAPTAASCADSWNADANAKQQATLAGVTAIDVLVPGGKFRVGTWPNSEQEVSVLDGFADETKGRDAVVSKDGCVVVLPDSTLGPMVFVEAGDKWGLVRGKQQTFPAAAVKSVAGARVAEPDALGRLKLQ